jgi:aminoglycoside phosphotransferase (APT) family kinase protein
LSEFKFPIDLTHFGVGLIAHKDFYSWETSTLGHPLNDVAHLIAGQILCNSGLPLPPAWSSFQRNYIDGAVPGMPTRREVVKVYADHAKLNDTVWNEILWASAFDQFRCAVLCQGIGARAVSKQSSADKGAVYWASMEAFAEVAMRMVQRVQRRKRPFYKSVERERARL